MVPIVLDWQKCPDGVVSVMGGTYGTDICYAARTARRQPVSYDVADLESPVVIHFLNADTRPKREAFLARFGMLFGHEGEHPEDIAADHARFETCFSWSADDKDGMFLAVANELLKQAPMRLSFDWSPAAERHRIVARPENLFGLMCAEVAMAADAGAIATRCDNCSTMFLVGHLTGRRSTARFCSDRCRMQSLRKNGPKGKR